MTTDFTDDLQLGELLRAEVPAPGDGYWDEIRETVRTQVEASEAEPDAQPIDVEQPIELVPFRRRLRRGFGGAAALGLAAALLLIVGLVVGTRWRSSDRIDVGFAGQDIDGYTVAAGEGNGPRQNLDHWNAVYGVWDCTANDGDGGWLDKFDSWEDDVGIHSHEDGLISIHPFFPESAEENAIFSHFADSMNFELTDNSLTLDDGRTLLEGTFCGDQKAVLHLRRWKTDLAARSQEVLLPQIITENLTSERFYNDREVWVLALAPLDADIPLPPADRFVNLNNKSRLPEGFATPPPPEISASTVVALGANFARPITTLSFNEVIDYQPPIAPGAPSDVDSVPESRAGVAIEVNPALPHQSRLTELIADPRPGWTNDIVDDTFRIIATANHGPSQPIITVATYATTLDNGRAQFCAAAIDMLERQVRSESCDSPTSPAELAVEMNGDYLFVSNTDPDAAYAVIEAGEDWRIVTNIVERHAYVGWDFASDPITNITFYNAALQPIPS